MGDKRIDIGMKNALHVPVIFIGVGNVGQTLLRQMMDIRESYAAQSGLALTPVGVADTSGILYNAPGLTEQQLRSILRTRFRGNKIGSLPGAQRKRLLESVLKPGCVMVDLTATDESMAMLRLGLTHGCGIVLANKKPVAQSWEQAQGFFGNPSVRYEATVGAGLPVISTLKYLRETGDQVLSIEGCLSGTLGYLCGEIERGVPYSTAVRDAKMLGYTEPDPRDDLSGQDVARKALILARTAGWHLEPKNIEVEPMFPDSLQGIGVDEFMTALTRIDSVYETENQHAQSNGQVLRYIAQVDAKGGKVRLTTVPRESAWGALRGSGNFIAFHTARYDAIPLGVSGPGAGAEVTAAGVLGDIIQLAERFRSLNEKGKE
jgi:homoserine dehydrogenase